MNSTQKVMSMLLVLLWSTLTLKTRRVHAEVQIELFTKRYQGSALADSFLLSEQCSGSAGCTLLNCAVLCAKSPACKSLSFGVSERKCAHYDVQASEPSARDTRVDRTGWVTYEKDVAAVPLPRDCTDIEAVEGTGSNVRGQYVIYPTGQPLNVLCDYATGSLWTVIDRRVDANLSFQRPLADFATGFGSPDSNFWIGLDVIHALTSSATYELLVQVTTGNGLYDAVYSAFSVDSAPDYTLRYGVFVGGTAGDALFNFKDQYFEGRDSCTDCLGWWVESYGCCSDTPHYPMNGEALWSSQDDFGLVNFQMMIRRV